MPLRLFVAIELDHAGKRAVGKLADRLSKLPGKIRWCGPEQMHLTLNFLGETPDERIPEIAAAMQRAVAGCQPFPFSLRGVGGFPDLRRPRVFWVGAVEPTGVLARLQKSLTDELAAVGFPPEHRDFHPHITLGRVKFPDRHADYEQFLAAHREFAGPEQQADKLLLISSATGGEGPAYTTVATAPLGA